MAEDRTDENRAAPLVPRMEAFARDFGEIPWAYFFETNAEFEEDDGFMEHVETLRREDEHNWSWWLTAWDGDEAQDGQTPPSPTRN